jgi:dipeptidyl aminopeptidase/acylaminoacyl peptidase
VPARRLPRRTSAPPAACRRIVRSFARAGRLTAVAATLFVAVPVPSVAAASDLRAAVGAYRFADGSVVSLVEQDGSLRLVDYRSGALRQLTERSLGSFVGGPGVSVAQPVSVRVALVATAKGHVTGLRRDGRVASRLPLVTEHATLSSGGIRLAARLVRPPGRGPFPAVVIVPGSVPAHADTYDLWALFFVSRGFAVLSYDKRGVGASTGHYVRAATDANLRALAGDALAAVDWLRRRPDIDSMRIGLSGGSQAGWTIAIAAARSPHVRFAAVQSGPAMSVGRQLAYGAATKDGLLAPDDEQIHAALDGVADSGYDPGPDLTALRIPVLWQQGAVDRRMYTPETLANLSAIESVGTHAFTVHVYPGGAHSLRLTANGTIAQERASPGFVPGVFRDLADWLRKL